MAALHSVLPVLNSKSEPPPLFDGTPRLYVSLTCPYAQRVWIARNLKGLSQIQIVPIDLQDRPAWYKEKVYPANKVHLTYPDASFGSPGASNKLFCFFYQLRVQ